MPIVAGYRGATLGRCSSPGYFYTPAPHPLLRPPQRSNFSTARSGASAAEKNSSSCGGLTEVPDSIACTVAPMVDLMLKKVQQQAVAPLRLHTGIAIDPHEAVERLIGQALANDDQAPVHRLLFPLELCHSRARQLVGPGLRAEPAAFESIDVEPVDDQDVVERGLDAREEAAASRGELLRVEGGASRRRR